MTQARVVVEGATKRYGAVLAVDGVSVSIQAGEVYSLIGANGAGKSTLIRMIVGITESDAGRITICGEDLAHRLPKTKRHLGYLPEELILYDRLTGREYLELVAGRGLVSLVEQQRQFQAGGALQRHVALPAEGAAMSRRGDTPVARPWR